MAVKIRLKRMGKIRAPYYRIVVADSRTKRDGRVIEEIGKYHPKQDPSFIEVDSERAQYWLGVGAQASEPVAAILKVTGDWQKFRGEPAPEPMLVAETRRDKTEIFNEALKDSHGDPKTEAVTARRGAAKKAAATQAAVAEQPEPAATPDEEKPVEQTSPVTDSATADEAVAEDEATLADSAPADATPPPTDAESAPAADGAEPAADGSGAETAGA